jgi:hypothetical protein
MICPVLVVDRYAGVRIALGRALAAAGAGLIEAEAGTLAAARTQLVAMPADGIVVAGLQLPDGPVSDLFGRGWPVIVYTWLPPDEREVDLDGADAVVGVPLIPGLVAALGDVRRARGA